MSLPKSGIEALVVKRNFRVGFGRGGWRVFYNSGVFLADH